MIVTRIHVTAIITASFMLTVHYILASE